jgi:hypothetical protein
MLAADPQLIENDEIILAAVDFGHRELVQWLIERGANPNARSPIGSEGTALHSAAFEGNMEMVKLLVAAGADIHAIDREYQGTPESWARAAIEITNNPQCAIVAEYLAEVMPEPRVACVAGRSLLSMSRATRHLPSSPRFSTTRYLPLSATAGPLRGVPFHRYAPRSNAQGPVTTISLEISSKSFFGTRRRIP